MDAFRAVSAFGPARHVVVIPCYNEALRLRTDAFAAFLGDVRSEGTALLFVNDGSRDETLSILEAFRSRFPERVSVLDQQPNAGKAEAVRTGMLEALAHPGCEITGFWDADLATPLQQIPEFAAVMEQTPELNMVFGARVQLLGRHIHRQPLRHYLGRCFATVASSVLRLPIYDTQCGAKLFRVTPELHTVLTKPFRSRWIFDVEMLARFIHQKSGGAAAMKTEIYEYPLPIWTDVAGSKVSPGDFVRSFSELVQIWRRDLH